MSVAPIEIARAFFACWNEGRIDDAIGMLSEDVLYDNVPLSNVIGRENVRKFHADFGIGQAFSVDWKVTNIAASGNVVLNERIDVFSHRDGGSITLPVMGTITVRGDVISVWRDYFDPADFERQLKAIQGSRT